MDAQNFHPGEIFMKQYTLDHYLELSAIQVNGFSEGIFPKDINVRNQPQDQISCSKDEWAQKTVMVVCITEIGATAREAAEPRMS